MRFFSEELYNKTVFQWRNMPMANYICPVTRARFFESETPRGYAGLMAYYNDRDDDVKRQIEKRLQSCSLCRMCQFRALNDTSIADAVGYFRNNSSCEDTLLKDPETVPFFNGSFSTDTIGKSGAVLFLEDSNGQNNSAALAAAVRGFSGLIGKITIIPPLVRIYKNGLWDRLDASLKELRNLVSEAKEVIVPSSLEKYYFDSIFNIETKKPVRILWDYLSETGNGLEPAGKKAERSILVPALPELLFSDEPVFSGFCRKLGIKWMNGPEKNYTAEPRYFASFDDPLYSGQFPEVISAWAGDIEYFASLLGADSVIFESSGAAEEFGKQNRDIDGHCWLDLITPRR